MTKSTLPLIFSVHELRAHKVNVQALISSARHIGLEVKASYGRIVITGLIYPDAKKCFICLERRQCGYNAIMGKSKEITCQIIEN